jgi:hypothetical protein
MAVDRRGRTADQDTTDEEIRELIAVARLRQQHQFCLEASAT